MCLHNPDPKPTREYGVGYKSVEKKADGVYTCYDHTPHAGSVRFPLNEWVTDPNTGEASGYSMCHSYPVGFHIMLKHIVLSRSRQIKLIKVRFRQVVATQTKETDLTYGPQVVARQVMNLGEV